MTTTAEHVVQPGSSASCRVTVDGGTAPVRRHHAHLLRARTSGMAVRLGLLALLVGLTSGFPARGAAATVDPTSVERTFLTRIAAARDQRDLPAYQVGGLLTRVAREQAVRMADRGVLYHNPNLTSDVPNWRWLGENVGFGPDAVTVHRAFMDSPGHRANVLDRDFTRVGVGAVVRDGRVWVAEVFKTPQT